LLLPPPSPLLPLSLPSSPCPSFHPLPHFLSPLFLDNP
jgi:hypothetical protein